MIWTAADRALLKRLYPNMPNKTISEKMGRTWASVDMMAVKLGLLKAPGYRAPSNFVKGGVPWNAGKKGWQAGGRARLTQFKKGNRSPRWAAEDYPVGALRINADGSLYIKLGDSEWDAMARYVWRSERGAIPKGRVVSPINGDDHDTRIENLKLKTRAELMLENSYHNYPKEIANLIQLKGAFMRQINRRASEQHR